MATVSPINLFAEDLFPPLPAYAASYRDAVRRGLEAMRQRRVVIAGLARNVAETFPTNMLRGEALGNCFSDYRIFIYENDSSDRTPDQLRNWSERNKRVHYVSETLGDQPHRPTRCLARAERMAYYRRACQNAILQEWPDYDCVILIDWDVAGGWSQEGVATTFAYSDWDFVGSNGLICKRRGFRPNRMLHYDAWAFRLSKNYQQLSTKMVNRIRYHRGEPLVPVTSCFGGLGVYTMQAYQCGDYVGGDIEHVSMHRTMRDRGFGRQYLNPSQIVHYGRRHRSNDHLYHKIHEWGTRWGLFHTAWAFPPTSNEHSKAIDSQELATGSTPLRQAG